MTAKKSKGSKTVPLNIKEKMQTFKGDILAGAYDEEYLKKMGLYERTVRRKARYWCFKMMHATVDKKEVTKGSPKGFYKFVENLPGFAGWEHFAHTWDISGGNPFLIVLRLQSVWQEWDHVMDRVSIPIDSPPQQIHERMKALEDEYSKKNK